MASMSAERPLAQKTSAGDTFWRGAKCLLKKSAKHWHSATEPRSRLGEMAEIHKPPDGLESPHSLGVKCELPFWGLS